MQHLKEFKNSVSRLPANSAHLQSSCPRGPGAQNSQAFHHLGQQSQQHVLVSVLTLPVSG